MRGRRSAASRSITSVSPKGADRPRQCWGGRLQERAGALAGRNESSVHGANSSSTAKAASVLARQLAQIAGPTPSPRGALTWPMVRRRVMDWCSPGGVRATAHRRGRRQASLPDQPGSRRPAAPAVESAPAPQRAEQISIIAERVAGALSSQTTAFSLHPTPHPAKRAPKRWFGK